MNKPVLQIFARQPRTGRVKTRLIPQLGAVGARKVYEQLLHRTIEQALACDSCQVELWWEHEQKGADLGERMFNAMDKALLKTKRVALAGSDCPEFTPAHFADVFSLLDKYDVVLTPAHDGGYVMIGARFVDKTMFTGIEWGTGTVFAATVKAVKSLGLSYYIMKTLRDVDTVDDYEWWLMRRKQGNQ